MYLRLSGLAAAIVASAVLALPAPRAAAQAETAPIPMSTYDRPGRLVSLPDRRRINLRCSGQGKPLVLLEAGFGASSFAWPKLQPMIAARTRVCSYDRAGYGFSDPGPLPRNGAAIARDLDYALHAAGEHGPYVAVGHSAGGIYAQLFAGRRRKEVVGLVLVDPSVIYQEKRMAAIFGPGAGSLDPIRARVRRCLAATEKGGAAVADPAFNECVAPTASAEIRAEGLRPALWRAQASELDTLFTETSDQRARLGRLIRDVPTIVLTASRTGEPAADAGGDRAREAMHHDLAAEFSRGSQRLVKSGHLMMNDRPDAVAAAALELVDAGRKTRR
ncbi:alpha/beta fold hydrolase [Phenylobacterium sp.]|uniref:alpha/beta fold hydrolase n=1 Tax=Phenylobacterium sp. TaxID=1871053 RepID=UPI003565D445